VRSDTITRQRGPRNLRDINVMRLAIQLPLEAAELAAMTWEDAMETVTAAMTVIFGMTLSLGIGLFMEELIFGKLIRLAFSRSAAQVRSGQKR
jgi:hypothetical protein